MTPSTPTVTIPSTALQTPVVLTHLTVYLLRARYAFLQTFHSTGHSDIDVFDQHQQHLVRCTIREVETDTLRPGPSVSSVPETLPSHLAMLIHDLVQACTILSEPR